MTDNTFTAGLEAAARWHDEQAAKLGYELRLHQVHSEFWTVDAIAIHERAAAEIRKL